MKRSLIFALLVVIAISWVSSSVWANSAPLPADMKIIPPGPDVDPDFAKFSGKWEGKMEMYSTRTGSGFGAKDHIIVVENYNSGGGAVVIYSVGSYKQYPAFARRYKGMFDKSSKSIIVSYSDPTSPNTRVNIEYKLIGDDKLVGSYGRIDSRREMKLMKTK